MIRARCPCSLLMDVSYVKSIGLCIIILEGTIIDQTTKNFNFPKVFENNTVMVKVSPGGRWKPEACKPRWNLAIIIPYR